MEIQPMDQVSSPDRSTSDTRASVNKVRRRNRMITSCLECRRRKLKCDKQSPCANCIKFSRDCMFLAPALDSSSQKRLNELKEKQASLERTLEEDVARRKSDAEKRLRKNSSADLPGEGSDSDDGPIPEDEKGLEATPLATVDATYDDDEIDDDILDLGFRVGRFRMTERLGGLFRPKLAEEMVFALVRDNKRGTEPEAPLKDDNNAFLDPGPSFIPPGSSFLFGDTSRQTSIIDFLPTRTAADLLVKRYHINCHFVARVLHWPSFESQYNAFWNSINMAVEPPASLQAIVFSVFFQAIASMSNSEIDSVFGQTHRQVLQHFQFATEISLSKAHVLRTSKFETLQAFIIYLIPMCRGEVSRAHSVLAGAAIRLGECFSLHRDPVETFGHAPIEAHVRRLAWFQLCYLDYRTAEAQGPRPSIKREDYDTKMPWNLDDEDLSNLYPGPSRQVIELREKEGQWTDMTLSKIRFECCEMHRIVWHDRIRLDKQKVSITHCLGKIESFRIAMEEKYAWLDTTVTIQHYARILLDLLVLRMHIMILHKFHNATTTRIPDRLRQVLISSGTRISESALKLDIDPKFEPYKWYSSALQQWHTAFLLLVEVFVFPNRKEADRIWSVVDHVFEPDLALSRVQKARSILGAVRDRAAAYRNVRKLREPISMRNRMNTTLPARGRIRGPEMILPLETTVSTDYSEAQKIYGLERNRGMEPSQTYSGFNMPTTSLQAPSPATSTSQPPSGDWTVEEPQTLFAKTFKAETPPNLNGAQHPGEPSPSNSSHITEQWPPNISSVQQATYHYNSNSFSPPQSAASPPYQHSSPPAYGNSAAGLMSGIYVPPPPPNPNVTPSTSNLSHSRGSSVVGPTSPRMPVNNGIPNANTLAMMGMIGSGQVDPGNTAWGSQQAMPNVQDIPMLDIDWSEWDKLFPIEVNNGDLDMPIISSVA